MELKELYLKHDQKPENRLELEFVDRKWLWHALAKKFNEPQFNPPTIVAVTDSDYGPLSAKYDAFPSLADKLEQEFGSLRRILTTALEGFRRSGMGDLGPDGDVWANEEEKATYSLQVYSSSFMHHLHGDVVAEYAYDLLMTHELLESATAEMPVEASHTSSSTRRIKGTPKVRPKRSRTGGKGKSSVKCMGLQQAMGQPVRVVKSPEEQKLAHYSTLSCLRKRLLGNAA